MATIQKPGSYGTNNSICYILLYTTIDAPSQLSSNVCIKGAAFNQVNTVVTLCKELSINKLHKNSSVS